MCVRAVRVELVKGRVVPVQDLAEVKDLQRSSYLTTPTGPLVKMMNITWTRNR